MEKFKSFLFILLGGYIVFYFLNNKDNLQRELVNQAQDVLKDAATDELNIINRISNNDYSDVE